MLVRAFGLSAEAVRFQEAAIPVPFEIECAGEHGTERVGDPVVQFNVAADSEGLAKLVERAVDGDQARGQQRAFPAIFEEAWDAEHRGGEESEDEKMREFVVGKIEAEVGGGQIFRARGEEDGQRDGEGPEVVAL